MHARLIIYACDALQERLPGDLIARVEERVFLQGSDLPRQIVPDVHVAPTDSWSGGSGGGTAVADEITVAEPYVVVLPVEITETFIEIREAGGGEVITVIEFFSPTNKRTGAGRDAYLSKQGEILRSRANLVEIDLIRAGGHTVAALAEDVPAAFKREYLACMSLGWARHQFELYAMPLRRRLPVLPIPLRQGEKRVTIDLQALLDRAYIAGRYASLNYTAPLDLPLQGERAAWAEALLSQQPK